MPGATACAWAAVGAAPAEALLRSRVMPLLTLGKTMVLTPSVRPSSCGDCWPKVARSLSVTLTGLAALPVTA